MSLGEYLDGYRTRIDDIRTKYREAITSGRIDMAEHAYDELYSASFEHYQIMDAFTKKLREMGMAQKDVALRAKILAAEQTLSKINFEMAEMMNGEALRM